MTINPKRWAGIMGLFLLGVGSSQLVSFLFTSHPPQTSKPVEITREATSSSEVANFSSRPSTEEEIVKVTRVIDGDTIELAGGVKVRYIGIDTPELFDPRKPVECFGEEAKEENRRLVDGKTVRLEKDISQTDKYRRLLRYVWVGEVMVNDWLVRQGFAHASAYPPDVKYSEQFLAAEREARENNRGLWGSCNGTNPTNNPIRPINETMEQSNNGILGCLIKGNISSSGEKIYHLPGCGSYEKTVIDEEKGERWFCIEEQAASAGWRKAGNCP